MRKGYNDHNKIKFVKLDAFVAGFHAYSRVCYNGKTHINIPTDKLVNVTK